MISIIVEDRTIVVDGLGARSLDNRVASLVAPDVRALQFHEGRGIGHIEFAYEYGDDRRDNQHITASDINIPAIRALHATLVAEEEDRIAAEEARRAEEENDVV